MKIGFYPGCSLNGTSREYNESVKALAQVMGLELIELKDWNCCGATAAHSMSKQLSLALPTRVLALAEQQGFQEIVVPCASCYNRLSVAQYELLNNEVLKDEILTTVGMRYLGNVKILNVYKGDKEKKGININLYEPIRYEKLDVLMIFGANLPMREDQTYIVFLKEEKTGVYNYVSSLYGKYNTKEDAYVNVKNNELSVKDMMKNDMILFAFDEEKRQDITSQMKDDGYNEQEIKSKLEGYQRLAELKDTREIIRASFHNLK